MINNVTPNLFEFQTPILNNTQEWPLILGLLESQPKSFDFNFSGYKVTVDSMDVMGKEKRKQERDNTGTLNPNQVFIDQPGGLNSYWDIGDSTDTTLWQHSQHKSLRFVEVGRNKASVFTTLLKDALFAMGAMTNKEAFGDQQPYTYQEFKGALSDKRTENMKKVQRNSALEVLLHALKQPDVELGFQVKDRPRTTPRKLQTALEAYLKNGTKQEKKTCIKEAFRLFRAMTEQDESSDTELDEVF